MPPHTECGGPLAVSEANDPFDNYVEGLRKVRAELPDNPLKLYACYGAAVVAVSLWVVMKFANKPIGTADAIIVAVAVLLAAIPRISELQVSRDALKLILGRPRRD